MPATEDLQRLVRDLAGEHAALERVVVALAEADWDRATPADEWAVRDQISHLAFFDQVATTAMVHPDAFAPVAERAVAAAKAGEDPMAEHLARGRAMTGQELLAWWTEARATLLDAAAALEPSGRIPWFGPSMSPMSFVSARLMETWAHGQDVVDALGATRVPTARLAHVARIGVRARPFSYAVRGLEAPADPVQVVLEAPDGSRWEYDTEGTDSVTGTALDFCLVVTQRRHLDDTALVVEGEGAKVWMSIAQAFAGAPGPGRPPLAA